MADNENRARIIAARLQVDLFIVQHVLDANDQLEQEILAAIYRRG